MKVVQIGLGGWGKNHTRILSQMGVLSAVCDINKGRMYNASYGNQIARYHNMDSMIAHVDFDIAVLTTPTITHFELTKRLLKNGKHVFVEKPLTYSSEQGYELMKLAKENNVKMTCGYIERFNPVTHYIQNTFKKLLMLEFHRESKIPNHIKDVGIVFDTSVHDIDTACHLFKDYPTSVYSSIANHQGGKEDLAIIVLEFPNDKKATIVSNWNTPSKLRTVHATFDDVVVRGDFVKREIRLLREGEMTIPEISSWDPLEVELKSFITAVKECRDPIVLPEHAVKVTEIAEMVMNSKGVLVHA